VAEGQVLRNAIGIGGIHLSILAETPEALGVLGLGQVSAAGVGTHDFAGGGDLEPLTYGFLCFDAFGTSHKCNSIAKEREI
jgi:hypothetical protein